MLDQVIPSVPNVRPESERIQFLVNRDGLRAARVWVERTVNIYRTALRNPREYAATEPYRGRFERAVREFEEWLAAPAC